MYVLPVPETSPAPGVRYPPAAHEWMPRTECHYDKFMRLQNPSHPPMSRNDILGALFSMGATWETLDHYWDVFNAHPYSIRIWDGSLSMYRQFCLDYFNTERQVAVNTPAGFAIRPVQRANSPGGFAFGGPLVPWEEALAFMVRPGTRQEEGDATERFSAPENAYLEVIHDNHPCVAFQVPCRNPVNLGPLFVQPAPRAF
ncbi:hypothetical protein EVG20_g4045 [Dentipellis fragilis]|uniref:Uncharacterized protein n=1 Tax=Dentipellis fragilis TaxID=205917 RepID=A0A4Y9YXS0_9AGAM|nr:hypothetical protein EVG20_g4045 [Dentipellis fragilis]